MPRVAYRETITGTGDADYTHKKQTGGHGQYARVVLEVKPLPRGEHFKFTNAIFGGAISKGYVPGVEKGVIEAMEPGILAGYPVVDIEATVVDGKEHPVDSSEMAFKLAARGALRAAMEKARPVLLEPIIEPRGHTSRTSTSGDVLSDLSSKRGRVLGQDPIGGGHPGDQGARCRSRSCCATPSTCAPSPRARPPSRRSSATTTRSPGKAAEDVIKAAQAEKEEAKA